MKDGVNQYRQLNGFLEHAGRENYMDNSNTGAQWSITFEQQS